jgi:hypothetical protein
MGQVGRLCGGGTLTQYQGRMDPAFAFASILRIASSPPNIESRSRVARVPPPPRRMLLHWGEGEYRAGPDRMIFNLVLW